jgi:hypothetical protein
MVVDSEKLVKDLNEYMNRCKKNIEFFNNLKSEDMDLDFILKREKNVSELYLLMDIRNEILSGKYN